MKPRRVLQRFLERVPRSGRLRLVSAFVAVALAAAVAAGAVYLIGGSEPPPATPTPLPPLACGAPSLIDPLPEEPDEGWKRVAAPPADDCFSLSPTVEDLGGIAPEAAFVLESRDPLDAEAVVERLLAQPPLRLEVKPLAPEQASARPGRAAAYRYSVTPAEPMAPGQVYRFTMLDSAGETPLRTWAFQTQSALRVVQTLPADQSADVPLNIGIELTFSHEGVEGVEERWQIEPAVQGRFEVHKRVVVFVPRELKANTLYTVTLKPGVAVPDSELRMAAEFLFQFETGGEERTGETPGGPPRLQFSRLTWEASSGDAPALALFGFDTPANLTLPFKVYRLAGADDWLAALEEFTSVPAWASYTRSRTTVDTDGLQEAASFEAGVPSMGEFGDRYVLFPERLPSGYYLVEATFEKRQLQALLQVAEIAAYVSLSGTRSIVWANDVVTKAPLRGATVTATNATLSSVTDADGVAAFGTPEDLIELRQSPYGYTTKETVGNLVVTAKDGRKVIVPLAEVFSEYKYFGFREYGFTGDPSLYWRFLYTDRHLYRPSDTVNFWGIVRRRESPQPSRDLVVEITGSRYDEKGFYQSAVVVASRVLTTTAAGTFLGRLGMEGVSPGYYELRARIGDQVISSTYVEVVDYVKPAYKLDVVPARQAVFAGDVAEYEVRASFFDGSPVPGLTLNLVDKSNDQTVTTDESGSAVYSHKAGPGSGEYGSYSMDYLTVAPKLAEEGEITGSGWVQVFPAALTIDAEASIEAGTASVSGTVFEVDLDRLNSDTAAAMEDYRGAPAADRSVNADIRQHSYKRIETGETYDFIAKIVRKTYRYQQVTTRIGSEVLRTAADGTFGMAFATGAENTYEVTLRVTDDAGRSFRTQVYASTPYNYFGTEPVLVADTEGPYAVGDEVALTMTLGDQALPAGGANRYLYYLAQNGIRSHEVLNGPRYSFSFTEGDVPNVSVMAVRFTGRTYQEVGYPYSVAFDPAARELTVSVKPGKDRYAPGEEAALDVTVTDREGRPVQAEVLLSAVDEAVFRLQGEAYFYDLDILETLYTAVSSGILRTYASHQYPESAPAAERGGGGGNRDDFKDVALFESVTTDSRGRAAATFPLPDNITSWRVTALALSPGLYAGSGLGFVAVGLPLFVDVAMNSSYLSSDVPTVKVRAFGQALSAGDGVTFQLSAPTLAPGPMIAEGKAFQPLAVALPPLKDGRHELTFTASSGGLKDSVVRSIVVVPSRLLRSESRFYELRPGEVAALEGAATGLTTVVLSDHNRGRYYPVLRSLSWTYGDRLDQMLARNLAQELLQQHFAEAPVLPAEFTASAYQTADGGIAIFPFADDDLQLSARAAALAPERFGRQALSDYFQRLIDDPEETRERVIIALYGQASLGQPVLAQVRAAAALDDLSARERLYLGLAAAEMGDEDTARAVYGGLLVDMGERRGAALRINTGEDQDDILEATSLAAILAASLRDDYAPLLFEYTLSNYRRETLIELEQISYLAAAMPALSSGPARFAYVLDGETIEGELERGESRTLVLNGEQLAALELRAIDGVVGVTAAYLAPFDPASVEPDPEVSLERSYPAQSDAAVTLKEGALVRITLRWGLGKKAVDGCYQVSDLLPSGLRPVTRPFEQGVRDASTWYPYLVEGQRVSFCVSRDEPRRPIVYYARVVGTGSYTAEPALIQSQRAGESINVTGSMKAEIR